jgi:hypothetical protein
MHQIINVISSEIANDYVSQCVSALRSTSECSQLNKVRVTVVTVETRQFSLPFHYLNKKRTIKNICRTKMICFQHHGS